MKYFESQHFSTLYQRILFETFHNPEYEVGPRGKQTKEIINLRFQLNDPLSNLFTNKIRSVPLTYLAGELKWYFSLDNEVRAILPYSLFWNQLLNPDERTVNSNYGHLLFGTTDEYSIKCEWGVQWKWALDSLLQDKNSRQAIVHFNKPEHQWKGVKDFPCTLVGQFIIRENKLNLFTMMRSQDLIKGLTFDLPFFTIIQQQMRNHLLCKYPDLELGYLYQHTGSAHIYETDFTLVSNMLEYPFEPIRLPPVRKNLVEDVQTWYEPVYLYNQQDDPLSKWILDHSELEKDDE